MRTVKRESVKLNKAKFDALERIARAFAKDKQAHLDFYQHDLNFSEAQSYRLRRNELKTTNHHASTPLSVHASDLAVKEAFETECLEREDQEDDRSGADFRTRRSAWNQVVASIKEQNCGGQKNKIRRDEVMA
jgi:hypothetical protein